MSHDVHVGRLPAMPSTRLHHCESPSPLSVGRVGPVTLGVSVPGKSLITHPPQDHDVGPSHKQALLASAATGTALLDTVGLPPIPSVAPEPTGFMIYRLPAPRSSGPSLPRKQKHGEGLKSMDKSFKSNLKFHHLTSADRLEFASTGVLLTLWSPQVPAPFAQYHGVVSPVVANYVGKTGFGSS